MAMKQEVNVPLIVTIGAVSVILLIVIVIGTDAWYLATNRQINAENYREYPDRQVQAVQDEQRSMLTAPAHWVDAKHTVAAIPIEQAMQLVIDHHGDVTPAAPPSAAPAAEPAGGK